MRKSCTSPRRCTAGPKPASASIVCEDKKQEHKTDTTPVRCVHGYLKNVCVRNCQHITALNPYVSW